MKFTALVLFQLLTFCFWGSLGGTTPTPPVPGSTDYGILYQPLGAPFHVLHLWGSPSQRGWAHGYLLTVQIVDFLEFYLIRSRLKGSIANYNNFTDFLQENFVFDDDFLDEIEAIYSGMKQKASNDSSILNVPTLGRQINKWDIIAINSYLETDARQPGPWLQATNSGYGFSNAKQQKQKQNMKSNCNPNSAACTQVMATGYKTLDNDFWAGRNMDGENDISRVTVTHLIAFAHEGYDSWGRFVSIMWPGFVGTLTGFNEFGFYVMLNCGSMGPYGIAQNMSPVSWQIRKLLNQFTSYNANGTEIVDYLQNNYATSMGGNSGSGAILMVGWPVQTNDWQTSKNIMAIEMDRGNNVLRYPDDNPDLPVNDMLAASNHFRKVGVNTTQNNELVYGMDVRTDYFDSRWRYEVASQQMQALNRTSYVDLQGLQTILKAVSHGTTEHSIIYHGQQVTEFWLAVSDPTNLKWDAPFQTYHHFVFEALFTKGNVTQN